MAGTTLRRIAIFSLGILGLLGACSNRNSGPTARESDTFVNKVWSVADSTAGPSGDLYVFLADGTLVIASMQGGVPTLGKWSWDGTALTLVDTGLPYVAEIVSLSNDEFRIRSHHPGGVVDIRLVPAQSAMPDTTRVVEFDPNDYEIRAMGTRPAWIVWVQNDTLRLHTPRGDVRYPGVWEQDDPSSWVFDTRGTAGAESNPIFILRSETCTDSTTGAVLPLRARLLSGEVTLEACALGRRLPQRK